MEKLYLSPSEILEEYPELKAVWGRPQLLGYLLTLKLVDGYKTARSCRLRVDDVLTVYNFIKIKS